MQKILIFFLLSLFIVGNSNAVLTSHTENWEFASDDVKDICNSVKDISIPFQDMPDETTKKTIKKCHSDEPYYGFESPPDYSKARYCAIIYHYYDVLAMIYASGKGVKPNLDLAIHFVCLDGGSTAEIDGRVKELEYYKQKNKIPKNFSICAYATTSEMMGYCTSIDQSYADAQHKKQLIALVKTLTPVEKKALQRLQNTSAVYSDMRIANEMDRSGSGANAGQVAERIVLKGNMMTLLDKTVQCKLPSYTSEQYRKADNRLNFLYKKTQNKIGEEAMIAARRIRQTERAWIRYKDSWVSFGHTRCPNISENTWKTLLTKERINQLKELASE